MRSYIYYIDIHFILEVSTLTYYARQNSMHMPQFGPPPMMRQQYGYPMHNQFPPSRNAYYPQNPYHINQGQQPFSPYQQMPRQRFNEMPDHLNTIMGHMGTITNGINMMRQVSSLVRLFRI